MSDRRSDPSASRIPGPAPQQPPTLDFDEILGLCRRYAKLLVVFTLLGGVCGWGVAQVVPKRFKSIARLNIQNNYFQNAALADMGSSISDPTEIQSQKRSLIDQALSNDFLDRLGDRHQVFKTAIEDPDRMTEREGFRKAIEVLPLDSSTYQVSASARTGEKSFQMTTEVVQQIIDTFISERQKRLLNYRDSLVKEIESIQLAPSSPVSEGPSAHDDLARRVRALQSKLSSLKSQYTSEHPAVLEAEEDLAVLQKQLKGVGSRPKRPGTAPRGPRAELYDEMMRKLKNLDVVLELEKNRDELAYLTISRKAEVPAKPISPKQRNFFFGGIGLGLVIALLWIAYHEMRRINEMTPDALARELALPLLGELPAYEQDSGGPRIGRREI